MKRTIISNHKRKFVKIEETKRSYPNLLECNTTLSKEKGTNLSEPSKVGQAKNKKYSVKFFKTC